MNAMENDRELFAEPPERLLAAKEIPEIAHHIVYEWGTLQVSEDAYQAYELVPLVPDVEAGPFHGKSPHKDNEPAVNVLLLGPNEPLADLPVIPNLLTAVTSKSFIDKDGVGILLNFGSTKDDAVANQVEATRRILQGVEIEDFTDLEQLTDPDGVPLRELLANKLPQAYAHVLADSVREYAASVASEIYRKQDTSFWLKQFSRLGALGMMGAFGMFSFATAATGRVSGLSVGLAGGYMAGVQLLQHIQLKKYMETEPQSRVIHQFRARQLGQLAGDDIHVTYCSRHFEESLQEPDGDSSIEN